MKSEINYSFCTAWSPCTPVVEEMARQYTDLKFEHIYYEPGMMYAGKDVYENGELTDTEYYDGSNDNYVKFISKEFDEEYYKCQDCGEYLLPYEIEDYEYKCPVCDSPNIVTLDGEKLTAFNWDNYCTGCRDTDEDNLINVIRRVG